MPLECENCGLAGIAETAKYCPRCAASLNREMVSCPPSGKGRRTGSVLKGIFVFLMIPVFVFAVGYLKPPRFNSVKPEKIVRNDLKTGAEAGHGNIRTRWNYEKYPDEKGTGQVSTASVVSRNTVEFKSSDQGAQHAVLTLHKHPKYGNEVILSIEKGRFLVGASGAYSNVCFDNNPVIEFSIEQARDNKSTHVVLKGYDEFVTEMKKSSKVKIEMPFKDEGTHVFEFIVAGLKNFD